MCVHKGGEIIMCFGVCAYKGGNSYVFFYMCLCLGEKKQSFMRGKKSHAFN